MSASKFDEAKSQIARAIAHWEEASPSAPKVALLLRSLFHDYYWELEKLYSNETIVPLFEQFVGLIGEQIVRPYSFAPYHKKITAPYNYEQFGKEFVRLLIDFPKSQLLGKKSLLHMEQALKKGDNVFLFANHQTELDPQIMSLLLAEEAPFLQERLTFVAGERVLKDPIAAPFSMGCSLFCIYSRKYIDIPLERKVEKQAHNKRTIHILQKALSEGGVCIFVAPSGGRDRKNTEGAPTVAPFEEKSIALFTLLAKKAEIPHHLVPVALDTYNLAPPPEERQWEIGERRRVKRVPVGLLFGEELELTYSGGSRQQERAEICAKVYEQVLQGYATLMQEKNR
ncbi:MAG: 1-acyl-sn-glycerol-3-phosphate acyltransferase [Chlamydiota bacterium]